MDTTVEQERIRHIEKMEARAKHHMEVAEELEDVAGSHRTRAHLCQAEAERHRRLLNKEAK